MKSHHEMGMGNLVRRTRGVQTGPRSQQIVAKVVEATLAELDRVGYAGLTMAGVAREAGVDRTTLYRRWPNKSDLLATLLEAEIAHLGELPTQGSLVENLRAIIRLIAQNMASRQGRALEYALTSGDPELRELAHLARNQILGAVRKVFDRAVETGEISGDADLAMMAHLLSFGTVHWVMEHEAPLSEHDIGRLISASMAGVTEI